eukprot:373737-Pelagomonas_calceolata.AAC.1
MARMHLTQGVNQGCSLSSPLFSLYIKDVDSIAEDVREAVTGTEDVYVTRTLYPDGLTLISNEAERKWAAATAALLVQGTFVS